MVCEAADTGSLRIAQVRGPEAPLRPRKMCYAPVFYMHQKRSSTEVVRIE